MTETKRQAREREAVVERWRAGLRELIEALQKRKGRSRRRRPVTKERCPIPSVLICAR
jgi:hypothetical protein